MEMPGLPHTGIYVRKPTDFPYDNADQALNICASCGHAQLRNVLEGKVLYGTSYTHRTMLSPISRHGNIFLERLIRRVAGSKRYKRYLEPGCNDMFLISRLLDLCEEAIGVDPIWRTYEPELKLPRVRLVPGFLEDLGSEDLKSIQADLLVSSHTLEHVVNPREHLERLVSSAADDADLFIEVPGFDALLENFRFDQVFHQHLHYFSPASLVRLLDSVGWVPIAIERNSDYWGGTLLVAARRRRKFEALRQDFPRIEYESAAHKLRHFAAHMAYVRAQLAAFSGQDLIGFGAAQMLPVLAYHLGTDLGEIALIYDDDSAKHGLIYPTLRPRIIKPDEGLSLGERSVFICAPDSANAILRRLLTIKVRRVIVPFASLF
jgi:hypothetical protein